MSASQVPANAFAEAQAVLPTNQPPPAAAAQQDAVSQPISAATLIQPSAQSKLNIINELFFGGFV